MHEQGHTAIMRQSKARSDTAKKQRQHSSQAEVGLNIKEEIKKDKSRQG